MAASINDKFTDVRNAARPNSARVGTARSAGGTNLACNDLTGWPTASKVHFVTYQIDSNSNPIAGTQLDCYGIVSGSTITNLAVVDGTDAGNSVGDVVEMLPTAAWGQDLADGLTVAHDRTGVHKSAATYPSPNITGTVSGTATYSSPTLTTPTIASFTNATHTHANATGGGQLTASAFANNAITASLLATNAILLGYATVTSGQNTSSDTFVQVTGLTATVTIPDGNRKTLVLAYFGGSYNSATNGGQEISVWDGVVGSGTQLSTVSHEQVGTVSAHMVLTMAIITPSAGSKTYNVGFRRLNTSGTVSTNVSSVNPGLLMVVAL